MNVTTDDQVIEKYLINDSLHQMIRESPHNVKRMSSQLQAAAAAITDDTDVPDTTATVPTGADAASAVFANV